MSEHESEFETDEAQPNPIGRIASIILTPIIVVVFFLLSLYLMEPVRYSDTSESSNETTEAFEMRQVSLRQGEPPAAPLTPVAASGGWDMVTAAKERAAHSASPQGYTADYYSFRYSPKMFASREK